MNFVLQNSAEFSTRKRQNLSKKNDQSICYSSRLCMASWITGSHANSILNKYILETTSTTDALGRVISDKSDDAYSMADQFISQFCSYIETIILPTPNNSLPCGPLHPVLFKKSRDFHLKSYTAPWEYRIDDKLCVFLPEMIFSYIRGILLYHGAKNFKNNFRIFANGK